MLLISHNVNPIGFVILLIAGIAFIAPAIIALIPMLLMMFKKTKKTGGVVSILFGVASIATRVGSFVGVCMVLAGLLVIIRTHDF